MDKVFQKKIGNSLIKLYNEDCLTGMRKYVEAGSVDVVVTSPPYNIGKNYNSYDDTISRQEYLDWLHEVCSVIKECMKDDGSFFLNIGAKPSDPWAPFEFALKLRDMFVMQNVIHWIKSIALEKSQTGDYPGLIDDIAVGHYQPVNSRRYLNQCHEYIFHFTKTGEVEIDRLAVGVKYQDKSNIGRWSGVGGDLRCRGNTWFIPHKTIRNGEMERPHPASFPAKLAEMCIRLHGRDKTKQALDPFAGIGNSVLACIGFGVDFFGFEFDESYFKEAKNRCEDLSRQYTFLGEK